jgi:hypothetical protein
MNLWSKYIGAVMCAVSSATGLTSWVDPLRTADSTAGALGVR